MIKIRHVRESDEQQLLDFRNDPFIYAKGFNGKPVPADTHARWFSDMLNDSHRRIFIIELLEATVTMHDDDKNVARESIGYVRFQKNLSNYVDISGHPAGLSACEISIAMPEKFTGKGYGTEAIRLSCEKISIIWPASMILARFQPHNCPSKAAFRKAGFVPANETSTTMRYVSAKKVKK